MTQMCSLLTETKIEHLFPLPKLSGHYHVVVDVEMLVLVMKDLDQPELLDGTDGTDEGVPHGQGEDGGGVRQAAETLMKT